MCINHQSILDIIKNNSKTFEISDDLFFVDVGAHDGVTWSNTYALEKDHGWKGICIEPMKDVYEKLIKERKAKCYNLCAYSENTTVKFWSVEGSTTHWLEMLSGIESCYGDKQRNKVLEIIAADQISGCKTTRKIEIDVPARTLTSIFEENSVKEIHYLSIDTEGSELDILKGVDFENVKIGVISAENNWPEDRSVEHFLSQKNYRLVCRNGLDDVYAFCG